MWQHTGSEQRKVALAETMLSIYAKKEARMGQGTPVCTPDAERAFSKGSHFASRVMVQ